MSQETRIGNNTSLCFDDVDSRLDVDSRQEGDRLYDALSEGGSEGSPMTGMPSGVCWHVVLSHFGIRAMVNHTPESAP